MQYLLVHDEIFLETQGGGRREDLGIKGRGMEGEYLGGNE